MRILLSLSLVLLTTLPAFATETDNYSAWGGELRDTATLQNRHVNRVWAGVLRRVNRAARPPTCVQVAHRLRNVFFLPGQSLIELWSDLNPEVDQIPRVFRTAPRPDHYSERDIYNPGEFDLLQWLPTAPTLRVGDVHIGSDKLSHFMIIGWDVYHQYLKAREAGADPAQAEERAVDFSLTSELEYLGLGSPVETFSVGDTEANFAGYRFWRGLCEDGGLVKRDGKWAFARAFDWRDHVTNDWDESFNNSIYSPRRWKQVSSRLTYYCADFLSALDGRPNWLSQDVAARSEYLASPHPSPSRARLNRWIRQGKVADPRAFTLEAACRLSPAGS